MSSIHEQQYAERVSLATKGWCKYSSMIVRGQCVYEKHVDRTTLYFTRRSLLLKGHHICPGSKLPLEHSTQFQCTLTIKSHLTWFATTVSDDASTRYLLWCPQQRRSRLARGALCPHDSHDTSFGSIFGAGSCPKYKSTGPLLCIWLLCGLGNPLWQHANWLITWIFRIWELDE